MESRSELIARVIGSLILGAALGFIGFQLTSVVGNESLRMVIIFVAVGALLGAIIGFIITPAVTLRPMGRIRQALSAMPLERLLALIIGVFIGLIAAALFSIPLAQLPSPFREILPLASALGFCYLGAVLMMNRYRDLRDWLGGLWPWGSGNGEPSQASLPANGQAPHSVLLDTSVIIDGRILDISRTGFLGQTLLIPNFVLTELQYIADSPDSLRRNRGRRGLEILGLLQNDSPVPIEITDMDAPGTREVDSKLVVLARKLNCPIMTNDYNLNRVADLQGITVLNINDLANAVKASFLPGEELEITVIQEGKEYGQGVGYLEDGTMVVIEDGFRLMNQTQNVTVTKVLQTTAGRMIFAKP